MKKLFVLLGLFLILQNISVAAEEKTPVAHKMSDVVVYSDEGNFGLKDKAGNIVVDAGYKKLIRLGNTSWIIQKKNRFGIMDCDGNYLVKPKYRHVERVFGKYAKLGNENDYGLYDETGKAIIPPEFSSIEPLFGQMFVTCKNYKYGIVNEKANSFWKMNLMIFICPILTL